MERALKILAILLFFISTNLVASESKELALHKTSIRQITGNEQFKTIKGFDFYVYSFENPNATKRVLIQGGLHGNEFLASDFVLWLAERTVRNESLLNLAKDFSIDFVPYANPDGTFFATRLNARQVNLNRNFDVFWGDSKENPGSSAFSEIETQAIKALFEKRNYAAAVDVHGFVNWFVSPSKPEHMGKNIDAGSFKVQKQKYTEWTNILKKNLPRDYEFHSAKELGDGGAFEDWAFWKMKALAFCFELSSRDRFIQVAIDDMKSFISGAFFNLKSSKGATDSKSDMFLEYERTIAQILKDIPVDQGKTLVNVP